MSNLAPASARSQRRKTAGPAPDTAAPREPAPPAWSVVATAGGVFVAVLALYLATLAPTVSWRHDGADSGELASAIRSLGIAHPTSYPLLMLVGRAAALWPAGPFIWRLNLFDALAGAAAAAVTAVAAFSLLRAAQVASLPVWGRPVAAALGGLAFGLSPLLWGQSTLFEVYALNALLVALITALALLWREHAGTPAGTFLLALLGITGGLALAHHRTALLALVSAAGFMALSHPRTFLRPRPLLLFAGLTLAGGLLYLYLPIRAGAQPETNWGDPVTLPAFIDQVTARIYQDYLRPPSSAVDAFGALPLLARLVISQIPLLLFLPVFLGVGALLSRRAISLFLGILAAGSGVFASFYLAQGRDVYTLPLVMSLALWLAVGIAVLIGPFSSRDVLQNPYARSTLRLAVPLLALGILMFSTAGNYAGQDLHEDRTAERAAQALLIAGRENGIVYSYRDELTFALWHQQRVQFEDRAVPVRDLRLIALPWYLRQIGAR